MMLVVVLAFGLAADICDDVDHELSAPWPEAGADQLKRLDAAVQPLSQLADSGKSVEGQVRELMKDPATLPDARDLLAAFARDACRPPKSAANTGAQAAADVKALLAADPRFGGVRAGDDVLDRLGARLLKWLTKFLESEGMQRYSGSARVIYLGMLVVAAGLILMRLVRTLRTTRPDDDQALADARARVELRNKRSAAELLAEARLLVDSDPHRAAVGLRTALLARVGLHAPGAVTPARTSREVLARLAPPVAAIVRPPLDRFDACTYSRPTTPDDARALLADVETAQRRLGDAP